MIQSTFIQYLLDCGCDLNQDHEGLFYKVKKRGVQGSSSLKTVMPLNGNHVNMKLLTICLICYHLDVPKPQEVREYYEQFFEPVIIANHLKPRSLN